MRLIVPLGFVAGLVVAAACTSNENPIAGAGSSSGADPDAGCGAFGTTAAQGQTYVASEGCANCHGANFAGSATPLVNNQEPGVVIIGSDKLYPPNLTPDKASGIGNWTTQQIYYAITEGIDNNGLDLCPEMGRHYPNMCASEANGIVAYLQSLPAVYNCVPISDCPPTKSGGTPVCTDDGGT